MAGQFDGIGKAIFDQPALRDAEQFGQRVAQRDCGNAGKEFGEGKLIPWVL
jgi:hypothetical protein